MLDNEFRGYQPEQEADVWAQGVDQNGGPEVYFEENPDVKISVLTNRIVKGYEDVLKQMKARIPFVYIKWEIEHIKKIEKLRRTIRANQCHQPNMKNSNGDRIMDDDIVRARNYPIENLVEVKPGGKVMCPFHNDTKASGYVKNGYFYCFTCNEWADSIKWLMKVHGYKFFDAVKKLR